MPMQVNITTKVNSQSIRRETYNGREHLVLPSYTLPANVVMNGGLYTQEQIDAHYKGLEGTLAPLGHPQVNGQFVSAFSPEGINAGHIGAWNRNVKKSGNRIYLEKWVDVARASESEGGRELLERVAAIERGEDVPPIHTSVAAFLDQLEPNEQQRATGAEWVADIHGMDHDAILLHEVGAATPEQGVGLMVNADLAQPLKANSGALVGESYREREQRLDRAAKAKFAPGTDEYAWVADFTDSQVVIVRNGGDAQVYGYSSDDGGGYVETIITNSDFTLSFEGEVRKKDKLDQYGDFFTCYQGDVVFWRQVDNPVEDGIFVGYRGAQPAHVGLVLNRQALHSRGENGSVRMDSLLVIQRAFTKVEFFEYGAG